MVFGDHLHVVMPAHTALPESRHPRARLRVSDEGREQLL
jgi:hypothetical protein